MNKYSEEIEKVEELENILKDTKFGNLTVDELDWCLDLHYNFHKDEILEFKELLNKDYNKIKTMLEVVEND